MEVEEALRLMSGTLRARDQADGDRLWSKGRGLRGLPRDMRVASLTPLLLRMGATCWPRRSLGCGHTKKAKTGPVGMQAADDVCKGRNEKNELPKTTTPWRSHVLTNHSTRGALAGLTSEIRRDPVLSGGYGRSYPDLEASKL